MSVIAKYIFFGSTEKLVKMSYHNGHVMVLAVDICLRANMIKTIIFALFL